MKIRKNLICSILAMSLAVVPNSFSYITSASEAVVIWESTFKVNTSVGFEDNIAHCFVEIIGYEWVSEIDNITITLWKKQENNYNSSRNGATCQQQAIILNLATMPMAFQMVTHTVSS